VLTATAQRRTVLITAHLRASSMVGRLWKRTSSLLLQISKGKMRLLRRA
jgi:hypothetical protein